MNFYETIKEICNRKKNITLTEMVKALELSTSMPTNWKRGIIPNGETLIKLADYLGVSIDDLLGRDAPNASKLPCSGNNDVDSIINDLLSKDITDGDLEVIKAVLNKYK